MKWLRKLYDWVLHWAETPYGPLALFVLAFAESSFFPIPPDALLIALCLGAIKKSWRFAFITSLASILGGMLGYLIGLGVWPAVDSFLRVTRQVERFAKLKLQLAAARAPSPPADRPIAEEAAAVPSEEIEF